MAKIYAKPTTKSNLNPDKTLILDSKDLYQVPFDFNSDWTHIKVGMMISSTTTEVDNYDSWGSIDVGNFNNIEDTTWIGVAKNHDPAILPTDTSSGGFIGYRADKVNWSINTSNAGFHDTTLNNDPLANSAYQQFLVTSDTVSTSAVDDSGVSIIRSSQLYEGGLLIPRGSDSSALLNYCFPNVIEIKIINKGDPNNEKILIRNTTNFQSGSDVSSGYIEELKNIMDETGDGFVTDMKWLTADLGDDRWSNQSLSANYYPDSFIFYNSSNALNGYRPRIHSWAVKKIS